MSIYPPEKKMKHLSDLLFAAVESSPVITITAPLAAIGGGAFFLRKKRCHCGGELKTVTTQGKRTSVCQSCGHHGRLR